MTRKSSTLLFFVSWVCFVLWGMEMAYALAFSMIIALLAGIGDVLKQNSWK